MTAISFLAMDEFALHQGHCYVMVLADLISQNCRWQGYGHSNGVSRVIFARPFGGVVESIRAVVIDMTTTGELEIRAHSPEVDIVSDLLHIEGGYGREVLIDIAWIRPAGCSMTDRHDTSSHQDLGCCSAIAETCHRQANWDWTK
ncbi:transposase [Frateuria aurantia]|uniref:transposase n=1 Tax=Frateuria aurantia TaxID=81475 RepID=UPI000246388B|nr:transposase [Frateuria aurantia]